MAMTLRLPPEIEAQLKQVAEVEHRSVQQTVLVAIIDNGEIVEVRVNDRGPMVPGRILDLSYAAARALGAVGTGVIPVRITVLSER